MTNFEAPTQCRLCNRRSGVSTAGFRQIYRQLGAPSLELPWWECRSCSGWFVYPVPTPEIIVRNCAKAFYNDPARATEIAAGKESVQRRLLAQMSKRTSPGPLLDFGCSFGEFLIPAQEAGWTACGFDPNEVAVQQASRKGFDVRGGWVLEEAGFPEKHFSAITVNDSFCFAWHPYDTLRFFNRLLQPGGVLAMRVTNKRFVLGVARALSSARSRNVRLSKILQGQFHAISIHRLASILLATGFERVTMEPWASSVSWQGMGVKTKASYVAAQLVYRMSFGNANLSPGVLLFAKKAR